jgi:glucan 1,3-beta-glucosidase
MGMIQTETPYYQPAPVATSPFTTITNLSDPTFANCASGNLTCAMAWGLRVGNSSDIYLYGAGLYNFFSNYDQTCLQTESCQDNMVDLESNSKLYVYNLNTKAATNMVWSSTNGPLAKQADNTNGFCQTINAFLVDAGTSLASPVVAPSATHANPTSVITAASITTSAAKSTASN